MEQPSDKPEQDEKLAQLIAHMQRNNLSYIAAVFVAWQMGMLDKLFTYGSGICS